MIIFRILLLLAGAGLLYWGFSERRRRQTMQDTPTIGAGDVESVADGDREVRVEIQGTSAAGPDGLLQAPLSGTPCVWHRVQITRRYTEWKTDSEGRREQVSGSNVIYDEVTDDPFWIKDVSGQVLLYPEGHKPDHATQVLDQHEDGRGPLGDRAWAMGVTRLGHGPGATRGHTFEEWILKPAQSLYVLGAVRQSEGIAIREPHGSPFIISTRDEAQLEQSMLKKSISGFVTGAVVIVATIVWWIMDPSA
ncbi:MAG TPA: GIDE domain-containing protein [Thermopolyspora sp.]